MRGGFEKNVYPYSNYRRRYLNMALDLFWAFLVGGALCAVGYFDLKGKDSDEHARTLWSQMVVTF